jgi:siroheme synthase-like protein
MSHYPVMLDLRGRRVVVVGGGPVAEEKVRGLLAAGARVRVVAAELTVELARLAAAGRCDHVPRGYRPGDLEGAFLVVAERTDPVTDGRLFAEAEERRVFANVQDDVAHCSFIAPAVTRQGELTVAITTGGAAPVLAVRLRQRLAAQLGPEYARFLRWARAAREPLRRLHPGFEERRDRWYRLVDSGVLDHLRRGEDEAARRLFEEILGVAPEVAA